MIPIYNESNKNRTLCKLAFFFTIFGAFTIKLDSILCMYNEAESTDMGVYGTLLMLSAIIPSPQVMLINQDVCVQIFVQRILDLLVCTFHRQFVVHHRQCNGI
jgi:hypothetical protein